MGSLSDMAGMFPAQAATGARMVFGVVTGVSPLAIKVGADSTPTTGIASTVTCAVDDRVLMLLEGNLLTVIGVVGGSTGTGGNTVRVAGQVVAYGGGPAPAGYLLCDGSQYLQTAYPDLYAAIGSTYGTADSGYFRVPDLRTRVPVGYQSGDSSFGTLGGTGGEKTHTLTIAEIPSHGHRQYAGYGSWTSGIEDSLTRNANPTRGWVGDFGEYTGGGGSHNNLQPYIVLNYIISTGATEDATGELVAAGIANGAVTPEKLKVRSAITRKANAAPTIAAANTIYPIATGLTVGSVGSGLVAYDNAIQVASGSGITCLEVSGAILAGGCTAGDGVYALITKNGSQVAQQMAVSWSATYVTVNVPPTIVTVAEGDVIRLAIENMTGARGTVNTNGYTVLTAKAI